MRQNDGVRHFAAETLKRQVRDGHPFDAVLIKLSGLEELRRAAGADWPRLREKIRFNSICFLKQCLGLDDIALPSGAGFLVIYGPAPPRNMTHDCNLMQKTLCALYHREAALRGLRVEVTADRLEARHVASLGARPGTSFYGPQGQFRAGGSVVQPLNSREMR